MADVWGYIFDAASDHATQHALTLTQRDLTCIAIGATSSVQLDVCRGCCGHKVANSEQVERPRHHAPAEAWGEQFVHGQQHTETQLSKEHWRVFQSRAGHAAPNVYHSVHGDGEA